MTRNGFSIGHVAATQQFSRGGSPGSRVSMQLAGRTVEVAGRALVEDGGGESSYADDRGVGKNILGVFLALAGAITVAYSMTLQRYALTLPPRQKAQLLCIRCSPNVMWTFGVLVYAAGNGLYTAALVFGPLSLLGGIFTTLLVFNLLFARALLGETLTRGKVIGCLVIFCGASLCLAGAPSDSDTTYTPANVEDFATAPAAIVYLSLLFTVLFSCSTAILWFEHAQKHAQKPPGPFVAAVMEVVYPASLGIDEGIAHLSMRAFMSMFAECGLTCNHWTFYMSLVLWASSGLATLIWLRIVFARYETTLAMPIEYGAVQVGLSK